MRQPQRQLQPARSAAPAAPDTGPPRVLRDCTGEPSHKRHLSETAAPRPRHGGACTDEPSRPKDLSESAALRLCGAACTDEPAHPNHVSDAAASSRIHDAAPVDAIICPERCPKSPHRAIATVRNARALPIAWSIRPVTTRRTPTTARTARTNLPTRIICPIAPHCGAAAERASPPARGIRPIAPYRSRTTAKPA